MVNRLLFERFEGIFVGTVVAELAAGLDLTCDPAAVIRSQIWQALAERGHGLLVPEAIARWQWSSLAPLAFLRATLPLAVFFHDEPEHWIEILGEAIDWVPPDRAILRIWAQIVADILMGREARSPQHLAPILQSPQAADLTPIERALHGRGRPLTQEQRLCAHTSFDPIEAIALALFYSGNTPHHFRLAVLRSIRGVGVPGVTSLIGSVVGARLGVRGIPWAWRCRKEAVSVWGETPTRKSHALVESLWLQWLGRPASDFSLPLVGAIATASTLQSRSRLALISQPLPSANIPNSKDMGLDGIKDDKIIFLDRNI